VLVLARSRSQALDPLALAGALEVLTAAREISGIRDDLFCFRVLDNALFLRVLKGNGFGRGKWSGIQRNANKFDRQLWCNVNVVPSGKQCNPNQASGRCGVFNFCAID